MDLYNMHLRAVDLHGSGEYSMARDLYQSILVKSRVVGMRKLRFLVLNNLALLHEDNGDLGQAEKTYRKALQLSACGPQQSFCSYCKKPSTRWTGLCWRLHRRVTLVGGIYVYDCKDLVLRACRRDAYEQTS